MPCNIQHVFVLNDLINTIGFGSNSIAFMLTKLFQSIYLQQSDGENYHKEESVLVLYNLLPFHNGCVYISSQHQNLHRRGESGYNILGSESVLSREKAFQPFLDLFLTDRP